MAERFIKRTVGDTKTVHAWTPLLAARKDMIECDEDGKPFQVSETAAIVPETKPVVETTALAGTSDPTPASKDEAKSKRPRKPKAG